MKFIALKFAECVLKIEFEFVSSFMPLIKKILNLKTLEYWKLTELHPLKFEHLVCLKSFHGKIHAYRASVDNTLIKYFHLKTN